MEFLGYILEEDSDKHNFCSELFTGDAYNQHTTTVTNIQGHGDEVTKEDINTGMNDVTNFILPQMPHYNNGLNFLVLHAR